MDTFPSPQHQEMINAISGTTTPIYESDNSEELKQWIPQIVKMCQQMTAEEPRLIAFVRDLHDMANRASLADWAANPGAALGDQGWSHLSHALQAAYPELQS